MTECRACGERVCAMDLYVCIGCGSAMHVSCQLSGDHALNPLPSCCRRVASQCDIIETLEDYVCTRDDADVKIIVACLATAIRNLRMSERITHRMRHFFAVHPDISSASKAIAEFVEASPVGQMASRLAPHLRTSELAREIVLFMLKDQGLRAFGVFVVKDAVNNCLDMDALDLITQSSNIERWPEIKDRIMMRVANSVI